MRPSISATLFVALATLGGYAAAFVRELGYTSYFGVPAELITISLTNILIATGAVIVVALLLFTLVESFAVTALVLKQVYMKRVIAFLTLYMLIGTIVQMSPDRDIRLVALAMLAFYFLILFALPLLSRRKTRGYANKLAAEDALGQPRVPYSILVQAAVDRAGVHWFVLLFCCWTIISLTHLVGRGDAAHQEWFVTDVTDSNTVVIGIYGDLIICGKLDSSSDNKRLTGEIYLSKIGNAPPLHLQWRKIGPLQPTPGPSVRRYWISEGS